MISPESRPLLAAKARLRPDRKTGRTMLLFPERGMVLNRTGADVLELCTGEHTVAAIVDLLAARYGAPTRAAVEGEVLEFLRAMADRALMKDES